MMVIQAGASGTFRPFRLKPLFNNSNASKIAQMTGIDCIAALKALGEMNRMRILRLPLKRQLRVTEIVQKVNISQYTVSKQLKVLRQAGLVEVEKQGKLRLYTVASNLKSQLKTNDNVLELGCCSFRFDRLPKLIHLPAWRLK